MPRSLRPDLDLSSIDRISLSPISCSNFFAHSASSFHLTLSPSSRTAAMHLQEVVICATSPTSVNPGPGTISLHDIQTGATLASFKQTSAGAHCTAVSRTRDGQGGFMLAAQPDKSIMNVYTFQKVWLPILKSLCIHDITFVKDQLALKIVLPEKLSCITVDSRGELCAGGTSQGRIYIWEACVQHFVFRGAKITQNHSAVDSVGHYVQRLGRSLSSGQCLTLYTRQYRSSIRKRRF